MHIGRLGVLLGACALLWAVESRWPLFAFGRARARHLLPNLVLASMIVALYELLSATNGLLEHANIAVPARADGLMRRLFVTPNMHKWHHSRDAQETDTNYGNIFSVWDRLFGTFTGRAQLARLEYGLDGFDGSDSQSLGGLLRMPIVK
jgi:sterol desaturase/sphingolipid hydroxylase (fatty acid hydroxylase superfamily)